jgi:hypothetical protein
MAEPEVAREGSFTLHCEPSGEWCSSALQLVQLRVAQHESDLARPTKEKSSPTSSISPKEPAARWPATSREGNTPTWSAPQLEHASTSSPQPKKPDSPSVKSAPSPTKRLRMSPLASSTPTQQKVQRKGRSRIVVDECAGTAFSSSLKRSLLKLRSQVVVALATVSSLHSNGSSSREI